MSEKANCDVHTEQIKELVAYTRDNRVTLDRIKHLLYGNGVEGLVTKIRVIEKELGDFPEMKQDIKSMQKQMWIGIGALLVLQPVLTDLIRNIFNK